MARSKAPFIVTTSWDDGHPNDLRLADKLMRHGMRGTFYIPIRYERIPRMNVAQMRELRAMGMEIGAHTVTHPRLTQIGRGEAWFEIAKSREMLEDILAERVDSFCYPEGKYRSRHRQMVKEAGYKLARTTAAFQTTFTFSADAMPVGFHMYLHQRLIIARHELRTGNLSGIGRWCWHLRCENTPLELAVQMANTLQRSGGILHIWGHSWEIAQHDLWPMLDAVLDAVANRDGAEYTTNTGVLETIATNEKAEYAVA